MKNHPYRRFHLAVLVKQDGTYIVRMNQPMVCCAERLALKDSDGILMFVIQVRCKNTSNGIIKLSFGNSQPCRLCCRALKQSSVRHVVYSTNRGFHCCSVDNLPDNEYCALA